MREAHVLMPHTLRHPVGLTQRPPVTGFRDNLRMPRPPDLQKFDRLGDRIVHWRERRGMKRPELARLAKIPYSTLAELENNEQRSTTKITQIAAALRINAHYLATDKGDPEDLTALPASEYTADWPFPFPRSDLQEFDEIELELAGLKFQKILDEIRSKRAHKRAKKAG